MRCGAVIGVLFMSLFQLHQSQVADPNASHMITSPGYPEPYPNGTSNIHHITSSNSSMRIKLTVTELSLPTGDILHMHNDDKCINEFGVLIGKVNPEKPQEVLSAAGNMCLRLSGQTGGGLYKIFWSEFSTYCGGTLMGPSGDVISPGYNYRPYPAGENCTWEIIVPKGQRIKFTINGLDIKGSTNCTDDRLEIKGLSDEEVICGKRKSLTSFTSTNNTAELLFIRDDQSSPRSAEGFWIKYKAVGCLLLTDQFGIPVIESSYYGVGEKVRFKCPEGQIYQSGSRENVRLCQEDNQWQNLGDICVDITCAPPTITHGVVQQPVLDVYPIGSQVIFSCDAGLSLVGSRTIVCTAIGDWNTSTPICPAKMSCPILFDPRNGRLLSVDTEIGGHAEYGCDIGYKLDGNDKITCQPNGAWNTAPPLCSSISSTTGTTSSASRTQSSQPVTTYLTSTESIKQGNGGYTKDDAKLESSKADNTGRDIGIGLGVLVAVVAAIALTYFIVRRRSRRQSQDPEKSDETYENPTYNVIQEEAD